jgi:hypothetical protein
MIVKYPGEIEFGRSGVKSRRDAFYHSSPGQMVKQAADQHGQHNERKQNAILMS